MQGMNERLPEASLFQKAIVWGVLLTVATTIFYASPVRAIFNRIFHYQIECTIDSARASTSGGAAGSRTYYLYVDTIDCGEIYLYKNFDATEEAERLNSISGSRVQIDVGCLSRGIFSIQANKIIYNTDTAGK